MTCQSQLPTVEVTAAQATARVSFDDDFSEVLYASPLKLEGPLLIVVARRFKRIKRSS